MVVNNGYTKRKEVKYYINQVQHTLLSSLLGAVLSSDSNSNEQGFYFVRSVYFDSINRMDLSEKEIGVKHRRKIRLRYYDTDAKQVKLETKEKDERYTLKQSLSITKPEALRLMDGHYNLLLEKDYDKSTMRLYEHLKTFNYSPVCLVDYEREAYVSSSYNVRINIDSNIRGTQFTEHAFEEESCMVPLIEPGLSILEVKHDGHLPDVIQQLLASFELTMVSYSKYYYGMIVG